MVLLFRAQRTAYVCALVIVMLCSRAAGGSQDGGAAPGAPRTICGQPIPGPVSLPPSGSGPVIYQIVACFAKQGGSSVVEPETYVYYIQTKPSRPSLGQWQPYDAGAIASLKADFRRLWATNFLDGLAIDVEDYPFANGVMGKLVVFDMEERQRVKYVDYTGSRVLNTTKIEDKLKEAGLQIRIDSFIDRGVATRVESTLREMLREKGHPYAAVSHAVTPVAGAQKTVRLGFTIADGPKVMVQRVVFEGNHVVSDRALRRSLKDNKPHGFWSFLTGRGTYKEAAWETDADRLVERCRNEGFIDARIGQPALEPLGDSKDGRTRRVTVHVPVTEGPRYRVGSFTIAGNTLVKADPLKTLFKLKPGRYYSDRLIRKGMEKAREVYGAAGYFEFTGYPDLQPHRAAGDGGDGGSADASDTAEPSAGAPPVVDVTLRVQEGKQYFVNRITFSGNTTTHDQVIRRELALVESGVFNTEALEYSIKRLNQLGYFKPLQGADSVKVEKTPGADGRVDVTLKVEEQNRNQIGFGAGVSEYDGMFANVSFTTSNLLGRGESATVMAQKGSRSNVYQLSLTEPYLFDRPISVGGDVYSRKNDYYITSKRVGYSEVREGLSATIGRPVHRFSRAYLAYGYEIIDVWIDSDLLGTSSTSGSTSTTRSASATTDASSTTSSSGVSGIPLFNYFLDSGQHRESRLTPTFVYNTVDNPIAPRKGLRISTSVQMAGGRVLRGTTDYVRPEADVVLYVPFGRRMALGLHGAGGWIRAYGRTTTLPYYLRYFLGGENQIRGVDLRTVGPLDEENRALGGNKYALFSAEYYFDIAGPIRALLFHDAGQAFASGEMPDPRKFRTSSGAELRITLPMLNVPFRLIYAWNIYRDVFQPAHTFRFAVGTTF